MNVVCLDASGSTAYFKWDAVTGAEQYNAVIKTVSGTSVNEVNVSTLSCTFSGLETGSEYTFQVRALGGNYVSYYSAPLRFTVGPEPEKWPETAEKVFIMYTAGHNNIANDLKEDIEDLCKGYVPKGDEPSIFLSYQRINASYDSSSEESYLIRYYTHKAKMTADTLLRFENTIIAASAYTLREVLTYIKRNIPSKHYGLLFSSHATGWLPAGYYANSERYDAIRAGQGQMHRLDNDGWMPLVIPERDPSLPPVKSIGADYTHSMTYEMELKDFAEALPMHLDYIFFDCCLMGGIEVAYELRDKCDRIVFSPTEVIASGFKYSTMGKQLLGQQNPDLEGVCRDYYEYYAGHPYGGDWRSATVTLIDCSMTEPVANVCREIFDRYRNGLAKINPEDVQQYYTGNYHWFYDLYDIAAKAGASAEELTDLQSALDGCIAYKAATDAFLGVPIDTYSGLSMYLPCNGSYYLDSAYKLLDWNEATGLVQ